MEAVDDAQPSRVHVVCRELVCRATLCHERSLTARLDQVGQPRRRRIHEDHTGADAVRAQRSDQRSTPPVMADRADERGATAEPREAPRNVRRRATGAEGDRARHIAPARHSALADHDDVQHEVAEGDEVRCGCEGHGAPRGGGKWWRDYDGQT